MLTALGRLRAAVGAAIRLPVAAAAGVFVGVGLLVLQVSNAQSYLSDAPAACLNCHVMTPYYASWAHSSHRPVAVCNDCHVPHGNPLRTLYFHAKDGLRHATVFTLRREPQVLRLHPDSAPVVQENCVRCHEAAVMHTSLGAAATTRPCWECHRETPHGRAQSLSSTPDARRPGIPAAGLTPVKPRPAGVPRAPAQRRNSP